MSAREGRLSQAGAGRLQIGRWWGRLFFCGFGFEKHWVRALHRGAVVGPAVALPQIERRLSHRRLRLARQLTALPLTRGQSLVCRRGHVEQHFAQVCAPRGAAHMLVDHFAPTRSHGAANQFVHAVGRACAFGMGNVVHRSCNVLNDHLIVQGDAHFQAMNRFLRWKWPLGGHLKTIGFHVCQMGFNVPQPVLAVIALEDHGSGV